MAKLWEQWSADANANTLAPPNGAPEGMKAGRLNDCVRTVMAACRELGDQITASIAGLGSMASQNANAVAITGGTVAGNGAGLTALDAGQLAAGRVPNARMTGSYDMSITGNAATATTAAGLSGSALDAVLPPGSIILWYGSAAAIPGGWHLCDGTLGTPNMVGAVPVGADAVNNPVGVRKGAGTGTAVAAGAHTHPGSNDTPVALTVAQMPLHGHATMTNNGGGNLVDMSGGFALSSEAPTTYPANTGVPGTAIGTQIGGTGGGATHQHGVTLASDGSHTHTITLDPIRVGLHYLMRA